MVLVIPMTRGMKSVISVLDLLYKRGGRDIWSSPVCVDNKCEQYYPFVIQCNHGPFVTKQGWSEM